MNVVTWIAIVSTLALSTSAAVWPARAGTAASPAAIADEPAKPPQEPKKPAAETPPAQDAADAEWDAAMALKKKAAYLEAAKTLEAYSLAHPQSPHASEALVEAGVCWYAAARPRMKLLRNTPESLDAFKTALGYFDKVATMEPASSSSGRAQYMRGQTRLSMGEFEKAEAEYAIGFEKFSADAKYAPKCLERRAAVRRHMLRTKDAAADYQRYLKDYPKGEDIEAVSKYLSYCATFDRPAPALSAEAWVQGEPTTIASMRGDLVAIYFFQTWCPHCEEVREALLDIVDRYEPLGVHFIGIVNKVQGETVDTARAALPGKKIQFPVLMDNTFRTRSAYHGDKIPDLVLIDRAGRVRWHDNPNTLNLATIEKLLIEDPSPAPATKPATKSSSVPEKPK
jgi:tetratricopeptide (TPR) repeat protein